MSNDKFELPASLKPLAQTLSELEDQRLEERAKALRHEAQEKLAEARDKLTQARKDLESTSADVSGPKGNKFGRKTAALNQLTSELQAAPVPALEDRKAKPPSPAYPEVSEELIVPDEESLLAKLDESEDLGDPYDSR